MCNGDVLLRSLQLLEYEGLPMTHRNRLFLFPGASLESLTHFLDVLAKVFVTGLRLPDLLVAKITLILHPFLFGRCFHDNSQYQ